MRPSGTHLYKRVCPSVRWSVRRSVTPVQNPRTSPVFDHGEILHWNKWSTNMFWEPPLLLSRFTRLFVHLSLHICHMINTSKDTARTHRCPVGLVLPLLPLLLYLHLVFPLHWQTAIWSIKPWWHFNERKVYSWKKKSFHLFKMAGWN